MKILHLTWNEGLSSVFPSQVLRPMGLLRDRGWNVNLIVGSPLGEFLRKRSRTAWLARAAMARETFGLPIRRIPVSPARSRRFFPDQALAARWLAARIGRYEAVILHCRGRRAAEIALAMRVRRPRVRVIFDCRGWEGPELLYASGFRSEDGAPPELVSAARGVDERQQAVARASDALIVVSRAMREVALEQWAVSRDRIVVVPCCTAVDRAPIERRDATRKRLGFEGRFVVVYCGSIKPYQMVEKTIGLFEMIRGTKENALFFGITPSPERLVRTLNGRGIREKDFQVVSAAHTEVPELLAVADLAVLLRDRSNVNRVASPVKFAEYLAAGVPVVLTEGIGDYSAMTRSNKVGCVLSDVSLSRKGVDDLAHFLDPGDVGDLKERCHKLAAREFSAERASVATDSLYRTVSGKCDHGTGRPEAPADINRTEPAA
jgi:glycosyltransferase involved in cell wall biosynthesis